MMTEDTIYVLRTDVHGQLRAQPFMTKDNELKDEWRDATKKIAAISSSSLMMRKLS